MLFRSVDKFANWPAYRSDNGLMFLPKYINAFMSLKVEQYVDLDISAYGRRKPCARLYGPETPQHQSQHGPACHNPHMRSRRQGNNHKRCGITLVIHTEERAVKLKQILESHDIKVVLEDVSLPGVPLGAPHRNLHNQYILQYYY